MSELEDVTVTSVDRLRTRVVLARLAARQDQLHDGLRRTRISNIADQLDWLIDRRTPEEQLAWRRQWGIRGLTIPDNPPRPRRRKDAAMTLEEFIEEIEFLIDQGMNRWEISDALNLSLAALAKRCRRANRQDLANLVDVPWADRTERRKAS